VGVYAYLNQGKINDEGNCATEQSVGTVFGTVTHAVMPAITSNDQRLSCCFQLGHHFLLVFLPVQMHSGKEFVLKK
jgi:hypothetical protein